MPSCLSFLATRPPSPSFPPPPKPPSPPFVAILQLCSSFLHTCLVLVLFRRRPAVFLFQTSSLFTFTLLYFYLAAIQFVSSSTAFSPLPTFFPIPLSLPSFLLPSPRILTPLPSYPLLLHYAIPLTSFTPRYPLHSFSSSSTTPVQVKSSHKFGLRPARQPESLAVSDTDVGYSNNNNLSPTDDQTSTRPLSKTSTRHCNPSLESFATLVLCRLSILLVQRLVKGPLTRLRLPFNSAEQLSLKKDYIGDLHLRTQRSPRQHINNRLHWFTEPLVKHRRRMSSEG